MDPAGRVDQPDALGHCLDLGQAETAVQRVDLPVDVGFAHVVEVDQRQLADSGAGQGFHGPAAHAANADHADMGLADAAGFGVAIQTVHAAKAAVEVGRSHRGKSLKKRRMLAPSCLRRQEAAGRLDRGQCLNMQNK